MEAEGKQVTHENLREGRPLPDKPNERMRYTTPFRKLVEDGTAAYPGELLPLHDFVSLHSFLLGQVRARCLRYVEVSRAKVAICALL